MASDLDRIIDKINYSRKQNYITQDEAQNLRQRATSKANKKGDLTDDEKRAINKLLDDSLNKKGTADKKVDNPPKSSTTPSPPPARNDPRPPSDNKDKDSDKRWKLFINGYNNLEDKNDKKFISEIFNGSVEKGAFWETLSDKKQNALVNVVKNKKISNDEKKKIKTLFATLPPQNDRAPRPGENGGGGNGNGGGGTGGGDGGDGGDGGGGGGGNGDDDADPPDQEPIVKGSQRKIKIPSPENRANYTIDEDSKEPILMPDIDKKVFKEVQRITKNLVNFAKEFIEGGINFDGIDNIAENEIFTDDGESTFEFTDFNTPGTVNTGIASERLSEITDVIQNELNSGKPSAASYNYADFINLFELRYNDDGSPYFKLNIELESQDIDDIQLIEAEE